MSKSNSTDPLFRMVEIDAWADPDGGWTWNDAFTLCRFRSNALDMKRVFLKRLAKLRGHPLARGVFRVTDDWRVIEIQRRKDGCPIWALIRLTP